MLYTGTYFLIALLVLILVHEFGHFLLARICGVKVLRFSFGFGRALKTWRDKSDTEYVWSLLPFGGYVKLLDENECEVDIRERHLAFNNKPLLVKMAVVLAGPLFNFLLACILLWVIAIIGVKSIAPIIDEVRIGSIAEKIGFKSGSEIVEIDGRKISSWYAFQHVLIPILGSEKDSLITIKKLDNGHLEKLRFPLVDLQLNDNYTDILDNLGIKPFIPKIPPVVGNVLPDSAAARAGLLKDDLILALDNKLVDNWLDIVKFVKHNPDKNIVLLVNREGEKKEIHIYSGHVVKNGRLEGFLGVQSKKIETPVGFLRLDSLSPLDALQTSVIDTYFLVKGTLIAIGKMLNGKSSIHNLSGPVGIAKSAGDSARSGLVAYLYFIAVLSISLGVLNLLPIPMLDGGHLLFYIIEGLIGRSLSNKFKIKGAYLGMLLLIVLTVVALTNDLTKMMGV